MNLKMYVKPNNELLLFGQFNIPVKVFCNICSIIENNSELSFSLGPFQMLQLGLSESFSGRPNWKIHSFLWTVGLKQTCVCLYLPTSRFDQASQKKRERTLSFRWSESEVAKCKQTVECIYSKQPMAQSRQLVFALQVLNGHKCVFHPHCTDKAPFK